MLQLSAQLDLLACATEPKRALRATAEHAHFARPTLSDASTKTLHTSLLWPAEAMAAQAADHAQGHANERTPLLENDSKDAPVKPTPLPMASVAVLCFSRMYVEPKAALLEGNSSLNCRVDHVLKSATLP